MLHCEAVLKMLLVPQELQPLAVRAPLKSNWGRWPEESVTPLTTIGAACVPDPRSANFHLYGVARQ